MKRLVIAGGGFAGFWAAAAAARLRRDTASLASLEILLVSRDDQLAIRPRLYEPEPVTIQIIQNDGQLERVTEILGAGIGLGVLREVRRTARVLEIEPTSLSKRFKNRIE